MSNPLNTDGERKPQGNGRFVEIQDETVEQDEILKAFLRDARATMSRRGDGVFIRTSHNVDSSLLHRYGIPVPGALIVPTGSEDVDAEVERVRSVIEGITRSVREEEHTHKEREKADAKRLADEEFSRQMEALKPVVEAYEAVAAEFRDSLGAKLERTEKDEISLSASPLRFNVISISTDYNLPDAIRYAREMPHTRYNHQTPEEVRRLLREEVERAPVRNRLTPKCEALKERMARDSAEIRVDWYPTSIKFRNKTYEWSDAGYQQFEVDVTAALTEIRRVDKEAWAALKSMNLQGQSISNPFILSPDGITRTYELKVGSDKIIFASCSEADAAYQWASANGAMSADEFSIREAVVKGGKIETRSKTVQNDRSWGARRTVYSSYMGSVYLGAQDSPLYQLAVQLIKERDQNLRSKEIQNLRVSIRIYAAESRTKGQTIAEIKGPFDSAIQQAIQKLGHYLRPRRGISVTVTGMSTDGTEGRTETAGFSTESEAKQYLAALTREKFV